MSDQLFIILQGLLAFGAPMALAIYELVKLRRDKTSPAGGGEPLLVETTDQPELETSSLPVPANSNLPLKRAA